MLKQLAHALKAADAAAMAETIGDDITLRVAVHDDPSKVGRPPPRSSAPSSTGVLYDIKVTETIDGHDTAVLMSSAQVAGYRGQVDGLLVVGSGGSGRMSDLTVFLRLPEALQALGDEMGRRMGGPRPEGGA
jgi:hypothetical protein